MDDRCYFISDVHLGSAVEPNAFVLLNFLKTFQSRNQISHLFLLGDIFDLWIAGHNYFKEKYAPIIAELRRLRSLGVEIHYFEGNHDLYLDHFFGRELQLHVYRGPAYFDMGDLHVRLEHGDQMDPDDIGYKFLRWFLRTRLMKWVAPRLSEKFVVWLGETMSVASRNYTSKIKKISRSRAKNVIRRHAHAAFRAHPFDVIISGHVHVTEDYRFSAVADQAQTRETRVYSRAINLGTWLEKPRALMYADNEFTMLNLG